MDNNFFLGILSILEGVFQTELVIINIFEPIFFYSVGIIFALFILIIFALVVDWDKATVLASLMIFIVNQNIIK